MKRTSVLIGSGNPGNIVITIKTDSKNEGLMSYEHKARHNKLVESIFKSMSENGCWSQEIKVK